MPSRVQMSRQHPWRAESPDAVVVDRRTKWGNPYVIGSGNRTAATERRRVIDAFRAAMMADPELIELARQELGGRDLACWCPVTDASGNRVPCHADVLLELANPGSDTMTPHHCTTSRDTP